ncbi:MAG: PQQ-dependent sugar dehydrogenase [Planctomycetes bacterium]|nr:PQQ-dependent sugar dehydrogenase [Planctomycetota bacterium]
MLRPLLVSLAAVAALAAAPRAQIVPTGFVVDTLVSAGLGAPDDFCFLPDGRVLIADRAGAVSVFAEGSPLGSVGTMASLVETGSERGLLSIEADPDFSTNGYFYVWYASSADAFLHLDRFTCTGSLSNPASTNLTFSLASRRAILASVPDSNFNHNGGSARFGPDGMLYLSIGDDATTCTAQSTTSSVGCLLRMNVSVAVLGAGGNTTPPSFSALDPGDNPLSANSDISQLVIAHGLRNPYRMEIDQLTGSCYVGDVGQNAVEEYSEYEYPSVGALPLRNFGWPWREGNNSYTTCSGTIPPGLIAPIATVNQSGSAWRSVMGGPRYRNQGGTYDFGASYEGTAFYLDYFAGQIRRLAKTTSWGPAPSVPGQPDATNWGTGFIGTTALRQGPDGALWLTQHPSTYATSGGFLKRVRTLGPTNSVQAISGGGQIGPAGQTFAMPVVARVFDTSNAPLPGGTVNFAITGPGVLSTTNPVIADANGYAQTIVTASSTAGGTVTVTASTPGSQTNGVFTLNVRKLTVTQASNVLVVSVTNATNAVPAQVPMIITMAFPRTPILPTFFGTVFANPYYPSTLVLEDAFGHFPTVPWANTGGIGTPGLSKVYLNVPVAQFAGQRMTFQAAGVDPITGWFLTNIEIKQF